MAAGDCAWSYGAFAPGETVQAKARDVTPGLPDITIAGKTGVAAANGSVSIAGVGQTMTQHGRTVNVFCVGVGATSGRQVGSLPSKS